MSTNNHQDPAKDPNESSDGAQSNRTTPPDAGEGESLPEAPATDPQAGIDREVGDLEDPDAEDDGALPGRAGGGLAGG
ncbi:hypothetical protein Psesu_2182 [Pseudoxanthomonas suwonensis 11-1]|uniref:Uncharacterized protein n=1 Tax=Pseudoxanthomonas suwonensis (strain 11-1) TaxID=743721 RepID=E6WV18_PSEUU|nr:hypothetical protein [Pseudoxanthomonas suwonensis]ADV28017.1 hypothetical protein Psesu_2182 [Pseudoxanthomonas suwonensis 11-1]